MTSVAGGVVAQRVSYEIGGNRLLSSVSLRVESGRVCAIVGPSGAGKSTLLKVMCGIRRPSQGRVTIAGRELLKSTRVHDLIGYVPQDDIVHTTLRVEDVFRYSAELRLGHLSPEERLRRIDTVLALVGLADRRNLRVRRLSGGQRKRVSIGVELITEPPVMFLDEPTSGLDPALERQLMQTMGTLAKSGKTVVLTTHIMESMDDVDILAVVCGGYLAFAGPRAAALDFFRVGELRALFTTLSKLPASTWSDRFERIRPQLPEPGPRLPPAVEGRREEAVPESDVDRQLSQLRRKTGQDT
ncbi:MAG: ABC transporter ATP-binding protein [Acidobacteriota bacterium]